MGRGTPLCWILVCVSCLWFFAVPWTPPLRSSNVNIFHPPPPFSLLFLHYFFIPMITFRDPGGVVVYSTENQYPLSRSLALFLSMLLLAARACVCILSLPTNYSFLFLFRFPSFQVQSFSFSSLFIPFAGPSHPLIFPSLTPLLSFPRLFFHCQSSLFNYQSSFASMSLLDWPLLFFPVRMSVSLSAVFKDNIIGRIVTTIVVIIANVTASLCLSSHSQTQSAVKPPSVLLPIPTFLLTRSVSRSHLSRSFIFFFFFLVHLYLSSLSHLPLPFPFHLSFPFLSPSLLIPHTIFKPLFFLLFVCWFLPLIFFSTFHLGLFCHIRFLAVHSLIPFRWDTFPGLPLSFFSFFLLSSLHPCKVSFFSIAFLSPFSFLIHCYFPLGLPLHSLFSPLLPFSPLLALCPAHLSFFLPHTLFLRQYLALFSPTLQQQTTYALFFNICALERQSGY